MSAWHWGESFRAPVPTGARGPVPAERRHFLDLVEQQQSPAQCLAHSWCLIDESRTHGCQGNPS